MKTNKSNIFLTIMSIAIILSILIGPNIYQSFAHPNSFTINGVDYVTKEEFEELTKLVESIKKGEQGNLTEIGNLKTKLKVETDSRTKAFTDAEFKYEGVGDIIASAFPTDQFRKAHNDTPPYKWYLCNGAVAPDSTYKNLLIEANNALPAGKKIPVTLPNLVGRYPRGLSDQFYLLQTLEDAVGNHYHQLPVPWKVMGDAQGGGDNAVARNAYGTQPEINTGGVVGIDNSETRPKTTVVNFYIRVN